MTIHQFIAYRNARKEENETFKMDFEEEFDQDLENNLLSIERYVSTAVFIFIITHTKLVG